LVAIVESTISEILQSNLIPEDEMSLTPVVHQNLQVSNPETLEQAAPKFLTTFKTTAMCSQSKDATFGPVANTR